jgi:diaminopimelate decarboxylase
VESPHELALLDQAARAAGRRVDVLLRVNLPGQEEQAALVMGGKPSPFGMDLELLRRCAGSLTPPLAGAYAWNISHRGFLMHPPSAFHCLA